QSGPTVSQTVARMERDGLLQMPVALDLEQPVALHAGHRLTHRGTALRETLGDPGPKRDDALLLELEDRPEIHLRCVDQPVCGQQIPPAVTSMLLPQPSAMAVFGGRGANVSSLPTAPGRPPL